MPTRLLPLLLAVQQLPLPLEFKFLPFLPTPLSFRLDIPPLPSNLTSVCVTENESVLTVSAGEVADCIAYGEFTESIEEIGWNQLRISFSGSVQGAYAAGLTEALLTGHAIKAHIHNLRVIYGASDLEQLYRYYDLWDEHITEIINAPGSSAEEEQYLHTVRTIRAQLEGLLDGMQTLGYAVSLADLYLVNTDGDIENLLPIAAGTDSAETQLGRCSALIKIAKNDVFFAHTTNEAYGELNRMLKTYEIPSMTVVFSSYAGALTSTDDFLLTSSGLAVMETSLAPADSVIGKPLKGLPAFIRVQTAVRTSQSAKELVNTMLKYNSDTYSSQWMVLDYKKIDTEPLKDAFYVLETAPGFEQFADLSSELSEATYWASYNWPTFPATKNALHLATPPNSVSYRAAQFSALHSSIDSLSSLQFVMRFNNWSPSHCEPLDPMQPCDPSLAISARVDLSPSAEWVGGTDSKATSREMMRRGPRMVAVAGPTQQNQPVFCFPLENPFEYIPLEWDFGWVTYPN